MIFGLDAFSLYSFEKMVYVGDIERIELSNMKVDYIKGDEEIKTPITSKEQWGLNTRILADFNGDLEAGNITMDNGMPIEKIKVRKRKLESMEWLDVVDLDFYPNKEHYNWTDRLVNSSVEYEYAIAPMSSGGVLGREIVSAITCDFNGVWVLGRDGKQFNLSYNVEIGDTENITKNSTHETIGGRYPIFIENGNVNYRRCSVKATIVSDKTLENNDVDIASERKLREALQEFLYQKKPIIYKDCTGNFIFAKVDLNSIKFTPIEKGLYDISFSVVEIGDANNIQLLNDYGIY